jgi:hypothetical protein
LPAETKIFTIWNESDYFNEELQACTVSGTCYGIAGSLAQKKDTVKTTKDKTEKQMFHHQRKQKN